MPPLRPGPSVCGRHHPPEYGLPSGIVNLGSVLRREGEKKREERERGKRDMRKIDGKTHSKVC